MRRALRFVLGLGLLSSATACRSSEVSVKAHGAREGKEVNMYTLKNTSGMVAKITNYGAILMELDVPDRSGKPVDVVLGFDKVEDYFGDHPAFGATVGRVANRIANGTFTLDGKDYTLAKNNGPHTLHGGVKGFDKHVWDATSGQGEDGAWVTLSRTSPDGEEGFPGTLKATVTYRLTRKNELVIEMTATTDRPTLVNLANHTYWNLGGHASGDVLGQTLQLSCDRYTPNDVTTVPKGTIEEVAGTPFDFTKPKKIGQDVARMGGDPPGYDGNFVVNGEAGALRPVARAEDATTGIVMELSATEPGVQLYTANYLNGTIKGKGGAVYARHGGFCLETQKYPDAIHHPAWPSPILRPGETYRHVMVHRFSTR